MVGMKRRAAIYTRVSADHTGEQLTVTRNEDDCRKLAKQRGWTVTATYADNAISATGKKHRPAFTAMLEAMDNGEIDTVIAWSLDRLARNARDRLALVEACRRHGTVIALVKGSDLDPTTASGRMLIGILGEVAEMEVALKAERQTAAAKQRSELGRPPLGVRLTGYTVKGELVPDEAALVRRIFKLFSTGESLRGITRILTDEGVTTRHGRPWNPSSVRSILVNPRYAGRAVYQGETTGKSGNWKPLVTGDVFDLVQAKLADPRRISNRQGTDRKHLGAGLYLCGECAEPVSSWSGQRYRCRTAAHVNRSRPPVDRWVTLVVAERLRQGGPRISARLHGDEAPLAADLAALRDRQAKVEADYDAGLIDGRRYASAMDRINTEATAIARQMAEHTTSAALADVLAAQDPAQAFLDASLMTQRAIIDALVTVRLFKGTRGSKVFNPDTVKVEPK